MLSRLDRAPGRRIFRAAQKKSPPRGERAAAESSKVRLPLFDQRGMQGMSGVIKRLVIMKLGIARSGQGLADDPSLKIGRRVLGVAVESYIRQRRPNMRERGGVD